MTAPAHGRAGTQRYLEAFERFASTRHEPAWLSPLRHAAIAHFAHVGFPSTRLEDWRYTDVTPIAEFPLHADPPHPPKLSAEELARHTPLISAWHRLVFVNGIFDRSLSDLSHLPKEVRVESLAEAAAKDGALIEASLGRSAASSNAFTALNAAFFKDGAYVLVPRGICLQQPIHLVFLSDHPDGHLLVQVRNVLEVEGDSRAVVLESYVSRGQGGSFTSAVSDVSVGEGGHLVHCKVQQEASGAYHMASTVARLAAGSTFASTSVAVGAKLARNSLTVALGGEGARCDLSGLYLATGRQHLDTQTHVRHESPHTASRQLYKGILDGEATAVFNGKVVVDKGAQKTDADQVNKNLLLSPLATVDTRPQLEIYADDVRCTHGAAVGQLSSEAVFYLKSRGLADSAARSLLTYGFAREVVDKIPLEPVTRQLDTLLAERFRQVAG